LTAVRHLKLNTAKHFLNRIPPNRTEIQVTFGFCGESVPWVKVLWYTFLVLALIFDHSKKIAEFHFASLLVYFCRGNCIASTVQIKAAALGRKRSPGPFPGAPLLRGHPPDPQEMHGTFRGDKAKNKPISIVIVDRHSGFMVLF